MGSTHTSPTHTKGALIDYVAHAAAVGLLTSPSPFQGYRLYFSTKNVTSMQPVSQNKSAMVETLTQLSEYSNNSKVTLKKPNNEQYVYIINLL